MNGILLINKPVGISSFDCIRRLRHQIGPMRMGHAGTLDPLASGLMIILVGSATKTAEQYSKLDKVYRAEITLGLISTTADSEGEKTPASAHQPKIDEIDASLMKLTGVVEQTPPAFSAIKVGGVRAYKLARSGKPVILKPRKITIYDIALISYEYPRVKIQTKVSSGTYIRSLAQDIGQSLGTGAYLSGLERIQIGEYKLEDATTLEKLSSDNAAQCLRHS